MPTEVRSFLSYVDYYRCFIAHFSKIVAPLYTLTEHVEFDQIDKCDIAFADLKNLVSTTPMLWGPNWTLPFHISSDVSDMVIG